MKNGAIYGALLRRLNLGIKYVNCNEIDGEVKEDEDDIKEAVEQVWRDGLARRINECEYELVCSIEQMRSYVQEKDRIKTSSDAGEYDDKAEKPISFDVFSSSRWEQPAPNPKAAKSANDVFSRYRESSRARTRRRCSSFLSDWDDDEEESDETRQNKIKGFIEKAKNVDLEKQTFEPYMDIYFPGTEKKFIFGWYVDSDGDYTIHDNELVYEYLKEKTNGELENGMLTSILTRLCDDSPLSFSNKHLEDYLMRAENSEDFENALLTYINAYFGILKGLSKIVKCFERSKDEVQDAINKRVEEMLLSEKEEIGRIVRTSPLIGLHRDTRLIDKIVGVDIRITKEQAVEAMHKLRDGIDKTSFQDYEIIRRITSIITEISGYENDEFDILKINTFIKG